MDAVIRFDQVTRRYGRQLALDNVSFDVQRGKVFALLGENGAGKTTALRMLLGLIEPTAGRIDVLGLNPAEQGLDVRRRVGYVPEQPHLYEWMTVGEIGKFAAPFYPDCQYLKNYVQLADELQLPWSKTIKSLSKGGRAKVSLALALAQEPELLVLDEPTSGLDLLVRRDILDRIVDTAASGRTVLLSSHQINEVERVADTVAIIHQGKLVAISPLDELKRNTQELTFSLVDGAQSPPAIVGELLRERQHARQWQYLVRNCPPAELDRLRHDPSICNLEIHTPRLEEIIASYLQSEESSAKSLTK